MGGGGANGSSRRPPGRAAAVAVVVGFARSLAGRAGGEMSGEDGPAGGPGAAAAAARERRQEQLRQWGARAGAEPGPGERRARTVRFERAAEFLAACAGGDLDEALLMLRAADPAPGAKPDPADPPPARAVLDSTNADGISALHQVSAPWASPRCPSSWALACHPWRPTLRPPLPSRFELFPFLSPLRRPPLALPWARAISGGSGGSSGVVHRTRPARCHCALPSSRP